MAALERMGGRAALLAQSLGLFAQELGLWPQQLLAQLQSGDAAAAGRTLHTQKGVAATLGLQALADWAREMEVRLKGLAPEPTGDLQVALAEPLALLAPLLEATRAQLQAWLAVLQPAPTQAPPAGQDGAEPVVPLKALARAPLERLQALLADSDMEALSQHAEMQEVWAALRQAGPAFAQAVDALDLAMMNLDLASAHGHCQDLLAPLLS